MYINSSLYLNNYQFIALELLMRQAKKDDSPLKGHKRTIQYLQNLGKVKVSSLSLLSIFFYPQFIDHYWIFA